MKSTYWLVPHSPIVVAYDRGKKGTSVTFWSTIVLPRDRKDYEYLPEQERYGKAVLGMRMDARTV